MGFEKYSVAELRQMLVDNGVKTEEEAAELKGKSNLVYELKLAKIEPSEDEDAEVIDNFESVEYVQHVPNDDTDEIPSQIGGVESTEELQVEILPSHPEWKEYVLSQFNDNEALEVNGEKYPTLPGLRRVAELLLGDIVLSGVVDHKTTHPDPNSPLGACSVVYEIQIMWKLGMPDYLDLNSQFPIKTFRGMAGANQNNIDGDFGLYPEAIAETRAEARALRKALSLSVVAYDELCNKKVETVLAEKAPQKEVISDWNPEDMINDTQKTAINFKCDQLGIDVNKFINIGQKQYASLDNVSKGTAAAMIKELSSYGQNNPGSKEIPANILKG